MTEVYTFITIQICTTRLFELICYLFIKNKNLYWPIYYLYVFSNTKKQLPPLQAILCLGSSHLAVSTRKFPAFPQVSRQYLSFKMVLTQEKKKGCRETPQPHGVIEYIQHLKSLWSVSAKQYDIRPKVCGHPSPSMPMSLDTYWGPWRRGSDMARARRSKISSQIDVLLKAKGD